MSDDTTPADEAKKDDTAAPATEAPKKEEQKEAPAEKPAKAEKAESTVELSKDAQKILDAVKELKVLDLANLVKAMEEEFGVSAAAPAAAAPAAGGDAGGAAEKTSFNVELTSAGSNKIGAIKAVKEITGLGLGEAKAAVESAPKVIKENASKEDAEEAKKKLEEAGCACTLK